ncbi:hypothetical protein [Bacillus gaemokensis]|uniref:Uncharacterized protein n=1 Tax=Bacillus gaemokensis TaxID=574375 RepID=A0A073K7P7_9BACI|nr:hypothetical protein [Bacillus gaemokensis]KEK22457.1 hypothetical protein BAGA_18795 [Bacillus gaemokensis]KYG28847.1 hypothetical protein AZF08_14080 [Bacillus gaemokensis]
MELRKTADGQSFIIEVEREKSSNTKRAMRLISMLLGIGGFLLSMVLFITIIGIIVAIPLAVTSIGLIAASLGYQRVECPNCNRKQVIKKGIGSYQCGSCKKNTLIEWK